MFMGRIKGFIIKTIVLLINAGLVVGGVFLIKNQNDKNQKSQTENLSDSNVPIQEEPIAIIQEEQKTTNVAEDIPSQIQSDVTTISNDNSIAAPVTKPAVVPIAKPISTPVSKPAAKKTTKTS